MAAASVVGVIAPGSARAQFAVGNGGHALDSNNQVGSGGINGTVNNGSSSLVTGNDIVYNNVTGGRGLTGRLAQIDPTAFRGVLPGQGYDQFVADSSGVPTAYAPAFNLSTPRPFFGDARGVSAPIGSVREGYTGASIGTSLTPSNPYTAAASSGLAQYQDQRLGGTEIIGVSSADIPPNLTELPGAIDSSNPNLQTALSASPLYGITQYSPVGLQQNSQNLNSLITTGQPGQLAPESLPYGTIAQAQRELQSAAAGRTASQSLDNSVDNNPLGNNGVNGPNGNNGLNPNAPGSLSNGRTPTPYESPDNAPLSNGRISNHALSATPLNLTQTNTLREGMGPQSLLPPPALQSSQYSELQKRMMRYGLVAQPSTPKQGKGWNPATTQPSGLGVGPDITRGSSPLIEPVKISSLASGVKAKGLHDLLASAEDLMRQGQFKNAITQYDNAIRVAPNNTLIALGRVNAELGGGFYADAEGDLRREFLLDPALLMARFDLPAMIKSDRIDQLRKDLHELAEKNPKESRPWLLLAYLDYNTNDSVAARADLEELKKRVPANDRVVSLIDRYWSLPAASGADAKPDLNK
jgi:hypothetical protein